MNISKLCTTTGPTQFSSMKYEHTSVTGFIRKHKEPEGRLSRLPFLILPGNSYNELIVGVVYQKAHIKLTVPVEPLRHNRPELASIWTDCEGSADMIPRLTRIEAAIAELLRSSSLQRHQTFNSTSTGKRFGFPTYLGPLCFYERMRASQTRRESSGRRKPLIDSNCRGNSTGLQAQSFNGFGPSFEYDKGLNPSVAVSEVNVVEVLRSAAAGPVPGHCGTALARLTDRPLCGKSVINTTVATIHRSPWLATLWWKFTTAGTKQGHSGTAGNLSSSATIASFAQCL